MRVSIDHHPLADEARSVDEAIRLGAAEAARLDRFVVEIMVDGQRWSVTDPPPPGAAIATDAREVNVVSQPRAALVLETACGAANALARLDRDQLRAAELIQADRMGEGMVVLARALGEWQAVRTAVMVLAEAQSIDLDRLDLPELDPPAASEIIAGLSCRLNTMRESLVSQDAVTLADLLLYDMPDIINAWRALLVALTGTPHPAVATTPE